MHSFTRSRTRSINAINQSINQSINPAAYAKANAVAYEVLGNLRTVLSVNGTKQMASRYFVQTAAAEQVGMARSFKVGLATGGMMGSFIVMYCIMTFFGSWLLYSQVS